MLVRPTTTNQQTLQSLPIYGLVQYKYCQSFQKAVSMSDAMPLFWQPVSLELQWKAICPTARHPKTRTPLFPKIHTLPAVVGSVTAVHGAEWAWVCPLFVFMALYLQA